MVIIDTSISQEAAPDHHASEYDQIVALAFLISSTIIKMEPTHCCFLKMKPPLLVNHGGVFPTKHLRQLCFLTFHAPFLLNL